MTYPTLTARADTACCLGPSALVVRDNGHDADAPRCREVAPSLTRLLLTICLGTFAATVAWRALDPMLPVLAREFHLSLRDVMVLVSAYSFPLAATQVVLG